MQDGDTRLTPAQVSHRLRLAYEKRKPILEAMARAQPGGESIGLPPSLHDAYAAYAKCAITENEAALDAGTLPELPSM